MSARVELNGEVLKIHRRPLSSATMSSASAPRAVAGGAHKFDRLWEPRSLTLAAPIRTSRIEAAHHTQNIHSSEILRSHTLFQQRGVHHRRFVFPRNTESVARRSHPF